MNENQNVFLPKRKGGLYANVKISLKTANILVAVTLIILVAVTMFTISRAGFVVEFDTNGGSHVESMKVMHSDKLSLSDNPVKEGYTFKGWYRDRDCTDKWDNENDIFEQSTTLYAGWDKK